MRAEAWCLGWKEGESFTDEEFASGAVEANIADTDAAVPADLRPTWEVWNDPATDDAEWRAADRAIRQYWVENCDIRIGTPITQP